MSDDVLVRVEGVSKKFCRDLKRSLWYGVKDALGDLVGRDGATGELRPSEFWALDNVSFELRRGECLGLIGRNGAGKTTLLKLLNGLIKPDRGRIEIRGRIGALIALGAGFNPVLTGRENIYVNASILGLSRREIDRKINSIIDFADIGEFIDAPVQSYSSGMAVRLGFAVATTVEPDVLLLDEVLAVGDVAFQAKCFNTLAEFRKRGTCFVLVSHNMPVVARYSQKVMYVRHGQLQHLGDVQAGIARYLDDMQAIGSSSEGSESPDWSTTLGSGKIKLIASYFLNAKDDMVGEIDVGEPLTLALEYERHNVEVKSAVLDVTIRDGTEEIYRSTNLISGQRFDSLVNKGQFRVAFDYLPVNTDQLDFFVTLFDESTGEFYDWKRNIRLKVRRNSDHYGRLVLPTKWSMNA